MNRIYYPQFNCEFLIKESPYITREGVNVYGYPYYNTDYLINGTIKDNLNKVSGYYFAIYENDHELILANDICGGYRVYYIKINGGYIFSDDYNCLLERIKNEEGLQIDKDQFTYWQKHRFTLDEKTLFNGIYKLSPASYIRITSNEFIVDSYYKDLERHSNYNSLMKENYSLIKNQLKQVYNDNPEKTFLLFYSGGADSTFLLHILLENNIPFKSLIMRYRPLLSENLNEVNRAEAYLHHIGIKDYDTIEIDFNEARARNIEAVLNDMLFDRHTSVHSYECYRLIREKYGNNVVIINGQTSDSILSFGPSEQTKGSFIRRAILYTVSGKLLLWPMLRFYMPQLRMPWSTISKQIAMLDETNYFYMKDVSSTYQDMLIQKLETPLVKRLKNKESLRMYLKLISFIQGPDNQMVIQAARHNGITHVVMPFTSPEFIYNTVAYKSNMRELFVGKYFVRDTLKNRFNYKKPQKLPSAELTVDFDISAFDTEIMRKFTNKIEELAK